MTDYKEKYLKYKAKYLALRGGQFIITPKMLDRQLDISDIIKPNLENRLDKNNFDIANKVLYTFTDLFEVALNREIVALYLVNKYTNANTDDFKKLIIPYCSFIQNIQKKYLNIFKYYTQIYKNIEEIMKFDDTKLTILNNILQNNYVLYIKDIINEINKNVTQETIVNKIQLKKAEAEAKAVPTQVLVVTV